MISLNDVLLAASNIPIDDPIAEIWGRGLQGGYKIIEYTGSLPITINANGDALIDYRIYGASDGVGEPTESGEPAGYKLPMTVGDGNTTQTVPVYIGENQLDAIGEYRDCVDYGAQKIVRRIAKLELDGSEYWNTYQNCVFISIRNYINSIWGTTAGFSRSSHYTPSLDASELGTYDLGGLTQNLNSRWNGNIVINAGMTVTEYKAYLASQAAAGTPVTFWYVVEIPVEQDPPITLPEIPTMDGATVIDYDRDPKPSQMYVKYKGKSDGA